MRPRPILLALACGLALAPAAFAQTPGPDEGASRIPVVDIVEVPGTIDRPIARYLRERIEDAERDGSALVLLQMDSAGMVKVAEGDILPPLVERFARARVPVAAWVGPRSAVAASGSLALVQAAHVAAMTPTSTLGPLHPLDLAHPGRWEPEREAEAVRALAASRGRSIDVAAVLSDPVTPRAARDAGLVDVVASRADDVLRAIDGRTVATAAGPVTLRLPEDGTDIRFHQPGPIRRGLHALANPALAYVLLIAGAMLLVFELFQPGFGVAGVSAALFFAGSAYGLTVLPLRGWALGALVAGLLLLTADVALHDLGVPTALGTAGMAAGSGWLFPGAAGQLSIPAWLAALGVLLALVFFVPVMTALRRGRQPVAERASRSLVGERGQVRSLLNPEGYVWVDGALWRARAGEGERIRVGEDVEVTGVRGAVLEVRRAP